MKIENLLDQTKHALSIKTDGQLARALGVSKQSVSDYYNGHRAPDDYACLKISEALDKPLDTIIATVKAATEKDETRREAWENYMKRLGGIAASIVFALLLGVLSIVTTIVTSSPAEARGYEAVNSNDLYYVNLRTRKRWFSKVQTVLSRIAQKCTFGVFVRWPTQIAA